LKTRSAGGGSRILETRSDGGVPGDGGVDMDVYIGGGREREDLVKVVMVVGQETCRVRINQLLSCLIVCTALEKHPT
jgi:hypothetical protein